MNVGIESLGFYTPNCYLDLKTLAVERGVDPEKFYTGIGQERMSVAPPDEDIVTMGTNAAHFALEGIDRSTIDTIMFATESGIDQSKAAAIYVHRLLKLPKNCKSFEIKQACCGSTAALQMAQAFVAQNPSKKVLIVASDIARYELDSPGEATQGAGAVAMVISTVPNLLTLDREWGAYTEDVMDFWRPNYREEALVDGKYSIKVYLRALGEAWKQYHEESQRGFDDHRYFCYHLPFNKMSVKAHWHLARVAGNSSYTDEQLAGQINESLRYSRVVGNSYTGSLYIGLASLLDHVHDAAGERLAFFSYGSGCMGAFFSGTVSADYVQHRDQQRHRQMLERRRALTFDEYLEFYNHKLPTDGSVYRTEHYSNGLFRLAGIDGHKRDYVQAGAAESAVPVEHRIAVA